MYSYKGLLVYERQGSFTLAFHRDGSVYKIILTETFDDSGLIEEPFPPQNVTIEDFTFEDTTVSPLKIAAKLVTPALSRKAFRSKGLIILVRQLQEFNQIVTVEGQKILSVEEAMKVLLPENSTEIQAAPIDDFLSSLDLSKATYIVRESEVASLYLRDTR